MAFCPSVRLLGRPFTGDSFKAIGGGFLGFLFIDLAINGRIDIAGQLDTLSLCKPPCLLYPTTG